MIYWAKKRCDPNAEIPFMKRIGDLQLKLGAPHELMMLGSHPLTRQDYEVFIGVPQRALLALFDGVTEIQENELPDKLIALVIREDEFDKRFPEIAAKRILGRETMTMVHARIIRHNRLNFRFARSGARFLAMPTRP